jgi:hypothetical protein
MGNFFSFAGQPSEMEVKQILNKILNEMMRRADLRDMYSLADPTQCSKYIIVGAKALNKLFTEIQIDVTKGEDGRVYFQKIDKIRKMSDFRDQQLKMCKLLAFFFVRIFRIYGALTLSIMDSEIPMADPQPLAPGQKAVYTDTGVPYMRGFPQKKSWWGGRIKPENPLFLKEDAGLYQMLNECLGPTIEDNKFYFDTYRSMTIDKNQLLNDDNTAKKFDDVKPIVSYAFKDETGRSRVIRASLLIEERMNGKEMVLRDIYLDENLVNQTPDYVAFDPTQGSSASQLPALIKKMFQRTFEKIEPPKFYPIRFLRENGIINSTEGQWVRLGSSELVISTPDRYKQESVIPISYSKKDVEWEKDEGTKRITVSIQIAVSIRKEEVPSGTEYKLDLDKESSLFRTSPPEFKDIVQQMEFKDSRFILQGGRIVNKEKGLSIPEFLQKFMDRAFKKDSEGESYMRDSRGFIAAPSISGTEPFFNVTGLWKGLSKNPPIKSHCIARAVQLLNVAAINDPNTGEAFSSICNVKFPYITNGSLPTPGNTVLTEDAINALAMLFVENNTLLPTNTPEYANFRKKLKYLFERFEKPEEITEVPNFDRIKEKQMPLCDQSKMGAQQKLRIQGSLISRLNQKTYELVNQQKTHVAEVMQLLFRLFDERSIRSGTELQINDTILVNGIGALNKLAEEARNLLINYYSRCEETYKEGLVEIHSQITKDPKSVVPY